MKPTKVSEAVIALCALAMFAAPAAAKTPPVATIIKQMKAALEPTQPSTRRFDVMIRSPNNYTTRWMARQARKQLPQGNRILTVIMEPPAVRGVALLIQEGKQRPDVQWLYLPTIRRVRKLLYPSHFQEFLGTDFTYADLGFVDTSDRSFKLLGVEKHDGKRAYKVEEIPHSHWYYKRIIDWIATDSMLPLQRDYYAPSGLLWRTEYFENVTVIDGVPTPLRVRVVNDIDHGSSELDVSEVRYNAQVPDDIFEPQKLPTVADHPFWKTLKK